MTGANLLAIVRQVLDGKWQPALSEERPAFHRKAIFQDDHLSHSTCWPSCDKFLMANIEIYLLPALSEERPTGFACRGAGGRDTNPQK